MIHSRRLTLGDVEILEGQRKNSHKLFGDVFHWPWSGGDEVSGQEFFCQSIRIIAVLMDVKLCFTGLCVHVMCAHCGVHGE